MTTAEPQFKAAFPYNQSTLTLPVKDINQASQWYSNAFGMQEVSRSEGPPPAVVLQRDGVQLGFAVNNGDAENDGAAILVNNIEEVRNSIQAAGVSPGDWRFDDRDGKKLKVFFVVAPDGLCFYFHQPVDEKTA